MASRRFKEEAPPFAALTEDRRQPKRSRRSDHAPLAESPSKPRAVHPRPHANVQRCALVQPSLLDSPGQRRGRDIRTHVRRTVTYIRRHNDTWGNGDMTPTEPSLCGGRPTAQPSHEPETHHDHQDRIPHARLGGSAAMAREPRRHRLIRRME